MNSSAKKVSICLVKSPIRRPADQKQTLIGLGLKRLNKVRVLDDTPCVRGMINKVKHLIRIIG